MRARDAFDAELAAQRIDKWLWHARFARTRGAAQQLATSGHVRLNRDKVRDASRLVRPGDVLTVSSGREVRAVRVLGIAQRRKSFDLAQGLYEDAVASSTAVTRARGMSSSLRNGRTVE